MNLGMADTMFETVLFSIKNGVATKTATELLNSMDSESGGELNGIFR